MMNSFGGDAFRLAPSGNSTQFIACIIVPGTTRFAPRNFRHFFWLREPVEATGVFYSGTSPTGKLPSSIRFSPDQPETL